jgi:hypothetical protein
MPESFSGKFVGIFKVEVMAMIENEVACWWCFIAVWCKHNRFLGCRYTTPKIA